MNKLILKTLKDINTIFDIKGLQDAELPVYYKVDIDHREFDEFLLKLSMKLGMKYSMCDNYVYKRGCITKIILSSN